jgi:hypothetical protein
MRQLVTITPARHSNRSMPHAQGLYGPLWGHLCRFLAVKYRIDVDSMRLILSDAFRYIDSEVMRHGEHFSVPGFGKFERAQQVHEEGEHGHFVIDAEWMRIDRRLRKYKGTLFTTQDDAEDAGPREE